MMVQAVGLGAALSLSSTMAQAQATTPPPAKVARVRAKLDGFDIAPTSGKAPNQIGGASRGLGELTLYAPKQGKAYSLTPTFYWNGDDKSDYLFKLTPLSPQENVVYTAKVTGGKFTYPADAPALKPSETYVWSVTPENDMMGGAASASVLIVGGANRQTVEAALASAKAPAGEPSEEAAKVYVQNRLWFDAVAEYSNLIERHPEVTKYYQERSAVYDQLQETHDLADADAAKAQH
jgi:hypothetical protein